jgi:hypothetical protein
MINYNNTQHIRQFILESENDEKPLTKEEIAQKEAAKKLVKRKRKEYIKKAIALGFTVITLGLLIAIAWFDIKREQAEEEAYQKEYARQKSEFRAKEKESREKEKEYWKQSSANWDEFFKRYSSYENYRKYKYGGEHEYTHGGEHDYKSKSSSASPTERRYDQMLGGLRQGGYTNPHERKVVIDKINELGRKLGKSDITESWKYIAVKGKIYCL